MLENEVPESISESEVPESILESEVHESVWESEVPESIPEPQLYHPAAQDWVPTEANQGWAWSVRWELKTDHALYENWRSGACARESTSISAIPPIPPSLTLS